MVWLKQPLKIPRNIALRKVVKLINTKRPVAYIVEKVMIHNFYSSLTSDLHPTKSNPLNILVQPWLFASILL